MFRIALVPVILLGILVLCRNGIAKAALERQVRNQTGMDLTIGRLNLGLRSPILTLRNIALMNTAEFGGSRFVDIPELRLEYDPAGFLSGKVYLKLLRFNLGEVHIVQNKEGQTNLQALRQRQKQRKSTRTTSALKTEFAGIAALELSLGRFKYTSFKTPANNQEIWIGAKNEIARDVRKAKDLEPLIAKIALEKGAGLLADAFRTAETDTLKTPKQAPPR
jgi:uncharacterized protein involved in outer membrane biogenesis